MYVELTNVEQRLLCAACGCYRSFHIKLEQADVVYESSLPS